MIGKITKGARTGSIGAYLHGPGRANEHSYTSETGQRHAGGQVIASNLPVIGDTDSKRWAAQMRQPLALRDKAVKQPIWQVSLALPPGEKLTQAQWADAAQTFVEQLGVDQNPWVAVHHGPSAGGNDHIHLVLNRVDFEGKLWAAKHDYRQVQKAATQLELKYGLTQAPRTRTAQSPKRVSKQEVQQGQQAKVETVREQRARMQRLRLSNPHAPGSKPRETVKQRIEREAAVLRDTKQTPRRIEPPTRDKGIGR